MDSRFECGCYNLDYLGVTNVKNVYCNLPTPKLVEHAIKNGEGVMTHLGAIRVGNAKTTGRSPNDRYIVKDDFTADKVAWNKTNVPCTQAQFDKIFDKVKAYMQGKDIYVQDAYAGTDTDFRVPIRVVTELAWHAHFARNMFLRITDKEELSKFVPGFTVIAMPKMLADPKADGINSETFILINFSQKLVLIGGTFYGGEIKKCIFTVMNFLMPLKNVMGMHCSANLGTNGDSALLFGLSGTGKTTLSADPRRALIGDDEHGWSENGIFNFEGGCYAKVINLSAEAEPEIYATTRKFGTILENVIYDEDTRHVDLFDDTITENTRASYPIKHLTNIVPDSKGGHPKNIIFLTADAFGVLPPISRLTPEQAMYQFLMGYTAKVAGTERGITEPQATFSTCFGQPFMPMHPSVYANMLGEKIKKYDVKCWLLNTGWTAGPYGEGHRISIKNTRALLNAALDGSLNDVKFVTEPFFGLSIPTACEGVPAEILDPKNTWANKAAYDEKAKDLAGRFKNAFKQYEPYVSDKVKQSGPIV